ncbi:Hypothetical_protein [Hexamita inflata]|uniref:Hypothetical_protein n=1 Tax=Hexamita inflata TaxID=28002 RepID=A0AA86TS66_9EUKA|nr:Hypothetical protein HINF_LOCUS14040 [Hexamita inflata]
MSLSFVHPARRSYRLGCFGELSRVRASRHARSSANPNVWRKEKSQQGCCRGTCSRIISAKQPSAQLNPPILTESNGQQWITRLGHRRRAQNRAKFVATSLSPMRVVNSRIPQAARPRTVQSWSSWEGGVPFSAENNTRPVRYETTGRTQAYQQAQEKKSKRDSPSSGERTGTCQA